jgi:hypothetical protein
MTTLWVICDGRAVGIAPVSLAYLSNLEELLGMIQSQGNLHEPITLDLCQKAIDLHKRVDRPGLRGFPLWLCEVDEIERLFGADGLIALNTVSPPPPEQGQATDPYPPYECPELIDSYLADLTMSLKSYREAMLVTQTMSLSEISHFLKRYSDTAIGAEERHKRGTTAWFWKEWMPGNQEILDEAIDEALDA